MKVESYSEINCMSSEDNFIWIWVHVQAPLVGKSNSQSVFFWYTMLAMSFLFSTGTKPI